MTHLFVLADDLSGAADCAVHAALQGIRTRVCLDPPVEAMTDGVTAVDADSRHRSAAQSAALQRTLLATFRREDLVYKKVDSTLRGWIAEDLAALTPLGTAIVAPAYPSLGRTIRQGRLFIARAAPASSGPDLPLADRLQAQGLVTRSLDLSDIRSGALQAKLRDWTLAGVQAIVCDGENEQDLARVARAQVGLKAYGVGSAGLFPHLVRAMGTDWNADPEIVPEPLRTRGPIVTIVGSVAPVNKEAVRALADATRFEPIMVQPDACLPAHCQARAFVDPPDAARAADSVAESVAESVARSVATGLAQGRDVIVQFSGEVEDHTGLSRQTLVKLGPSLAAFLTQAGALILTGGETARAVLSGMGESTLIPLTELEAGVVLSRTAKGRQLVVTKAGGFGERNTLVRVYRLLSLWRASRDPLRLDGNDRGTS